MSPTAFLFLFFSRATEIAKLNKYKGSTKTKITIINVLYDYTVLVQGDGYISYIKLYPLLK